MTPRNTPKVRAASRWQSGRNALQTSACLRFSKTVRTDRRALLTSSLCLAPARPFEKALDRGEFRLRSPPGRDSRSGGEGGKTSRAPVPRQAWEPGDEEHPPPTEVPAQAGRPRRRGGAEAETSRSPSSEREAAASAGGESRAARLGDTVLAGGSPSFEGNPAQSPLPTWRAHLETSAGALHEAKGGGEGVPKAWNISPLPRGSARQGKVLGILGVFSKHDLGKVVFRTTWLVS